MTILDDIARYKRQEIKDAKAKRSLSQLEAQTRQVGAVRAFGQALQLKKEQATYGLIAEIKKASPSRGLIRGDFHPAALASAYQSGGAACLSVLTDTPSFQGRPSFLTQAREASTLPVLRKDFMLDPYQVVEARALGADCILVILAMVDDTIAFELLESARAQGMDSLVEVHDERELDRALALGAHMIGINNRDLRTFATDLNVTLRLAPRIPTDRIVVAESGLSTAQDLKLLAEHGVTTFLIGESLMRESDVAAATARLLSARLS